MLQKRVFTSAKWIIGCRIAQAVLQLVLGMLSARFLGPSNYGLLGYAGSVATFVLPFVLMGMQSILVREFISNPEKEGQILGTSLAMSMVSSLGCMVAVTGFAMAANRGQWETILVCALYSTSLFFQSFELIQCWFYAKIQSKPASLASLAAYILASAYKLYLLTSSKSIYWFALSHTVEYGLTVVILLIVYRKTGTQRISISLPLVKELFSKSKFYILASVMVTIFQNTDHIMLKFMLGNEANGFYTAAVTCTGLSGFVYAAIIDSARPAVLESQKQSEEAFEKSLISLYAVILFLSLAQSIAFTCLAKPIILILYGEAYLPAVTVLRIETWILAASHIGTVRNIWILGKEKHHILWVINLCGVVSNVLLNGLMIPLWGAAGAAAASVLTQFTMNFLVGFLIKPIRRNNALILQSLHPRHLTELVRHRQTSE